MNALIRVQNLSIVSREGIVLDHLSFTLWQNKPLTILGETGSGKSILAQAIFGVLPPGLEVSGQIFIGERALSSMTKREHRVLWGRALTLLPQEPWNALDPLMISEKQVQEVYECVGGQSRPEARQQGRSILNAFGLEGNGHKFPGQLSGGMAQRVAFCAAIAGGAPIVIADEPTKGLDASRRDAAVRMLKSHSRNQGLLTITHDIEVARQLGGTIMILREGKLLESGPAAQVLSRPASEYAAELIGAAPAAWKPLRNKLPVKSRTQSVIRADGISKTRGGQELFRELSLEISPGEIIGVAGDSGCGKSTFGDILLGNLKPDAGAVFRQPGFAPHRFLKLYQDPPAAFAPGIALGRLLDDVIRLHRLDPARLPLLMKRVGLGLQLLNRTTAEVSGGELQRMAIVRALLLNPVFLFADEPTSRLDPLTAKHLILLLADMACEYRCGLLLVSHDPDLIEKTCDRSLVLTPRPCAAELSLLPA